MKSVITPSAKYTKYSLADRGTIKPYRPHKATHLVFSSSENAEKSIKGNHTYVNLQDGQRLDEKIAHYKEIGFTAASIYVDHERADAPKSKQDIDTLKKLQENFRIVYCVFADGFAKDYSVAKKAPARKKNARPNGQKQAPKRKPQQGQQRRTNKKPQASINK